MKVGSGQNAKGSMPIVPEEDEELLDEVEAPLLLAPEVVAPLDDECPFEEPEEEECPLEDEAAVEVEIVTWPEDVLLEDELLLAVVLALEVDAALELAVVEAIVPAELAPPLDPLQARHSAGSDTASNRERWGVMKPREAQPAQRRRRVSQRSDRGRGSYGRGAAIGRRSRR
jgi:hypothetical protein